MNIHRANQLTAADLGIDLGTKREADLFKWLLASLLFGKPIQQHIARRAYDALVGAGITSLSKLNKTTWDELVELLDNAHYVRYDFSTATKLLSVGRALKTRYGSVKALLDQSQDVRDLEERLEEFTGIGPVTAGIFIREAAPQWFDETVSHDYDAAREVAHILAAHGFEAYIIGGAVRDVLLGRQPKDFDVATNATPIQLTNIPELGHTTYKDTAQAYGVTRTTYEYNGRPVSLEIATFRKDLDAHLGRKATTVVFSTLEDDVLRRDFTINALALDPDTGFVADFVGGIEDLARQSVRFIGDPAARIQEDPLRILRAVRLKNQLGFTYDAATAEAITRAVQTDAVERIAPDRLRDELTRMLVHDSRHQAIEDLDAFGILERILPEVTAGKGVEQQGRYHAEGDVWQHQLLILEKLPPHPSPRLAWAALLHDIGKMPTRMETPPDGQEVHFYRHYAVGAEMATAVLRRLKFSNHDIRDIHWMVYHHLNIDDVPDMRPSVQQRMLKHPAFADLLEMHRADAAASLRPGSGRSAKPRFRSIEQIWHAYQSRTPEQQQSSLKHDLGIDGTWVRKLFAVELSELPPAVIGEVLEDLDDWYRDEGATNPTLYIARAKKMLDAKRAENAQAPHGRNR